MLKDRRTTGLSEASVERQCAYHQPSEGRNPRPTKAQKGKMCQGTYPYIFKSPRTRMDLTRSSDQPSIHPAEQGSFESNAFLSSTPHTSFQETHLRKILSSYKEVLHTLCHCLTKAGAKSSQLSGLVLQILRMVIQQAKFIQSAIKLPKPWSGL